MSAEQVSSDRQSIMDLLNEHMPITEAASKASLAIFAAYSAALRERDQYKQIAAINLETVKTIQDSHAQELVRLANAVRSHR